MKRNIYETVTFIIMFAVMSFFALIYSNQLVMNYTNNRNYNDFYGEHSMKMKIESGNSDFSFDPSSLGDNFVIYNTLMDLSGDYSNDRVRVFYGKGNYPVPQLTEGNFFTKEQIMSETPVCVAGSVALERSCYEENGKKYYRYNNVAYEVIGVLGTGEASDLDLIVMLNWGAYYVNGIYSTKYLIDSEDADNIRTVYDTLEAYVESQSTEKKPIKALNIYYENNIRSFDSFAKFIYAGAVLIFAVNILITSFHYADKRRYLIAVKKFIGAPCGRLFWEISGRFATNALIGYAITMIAVGFLNFNETFKQSEFGYFSNLNVTAMLLSLAVILALAVVFSLIPVFKAFRTDTSEAIRG